MIEGIRNQERNDDSMLSDFHLHSNFSGDSEASPEAMIQQAIRLGMKEMCFTDHYDVDFPGETDLFLFDIHDYFDCLHQLKEKYRSKIDIRIGMELGLQTHLKEICEKITREHMFDFVIGSIHVVNGQDPYYPAFFEGRSEQECYQEYFETVLENLKKTDGYDVVGHIDYIVRYGPDKNKYYSYEAYHDILECILRTCIEKGTGLELNTGCLAYGLGHPNPHPDLLRRYHALGGEIVTVGSDAHNPERLGFQFEQAKELLKNCGFHYYTVFQGRKPQFVKL